MRAILLSRAGETIGVVAAAGYGMSSAASEHGIASADGSAVMLALALYEYRLEGLSRSRSSGQIDPASPAGKFRLFRGAFAEGGGRLGAPVAPMAAGLCRRFVEANAAK